MKRASQNRDPKNHRAEQLKRQAEQPPVGLIAEFVDFVLHNKKWWLTPIVVILLLLGLLAILSSSGAAPFLYTLF